MVWFLFPLQSLLFLENLAQDGTQKVFLKYLLTIILMILRITLVFGFEINVSLCHWPFFQIFLQISTNILSFVIFSSVTTWSFISSANLVYNLKSLKYLFGFRYLRIYFSFILAFIFSFIYTFLTSLTFPMGTIRLIILLIDFPPKTRLTSSQ